MLRPEGTPLRNLFQGDNWTRWKTRLRRFLLDLDARIDFGMYQAKTWGRELYERFTVFMDRFHVAGWRRWCFVEPLSESLTLGNGGLLVLLALAIPAFRETSDDDWLKKSELATSQAEIELKQITAERANAREATHAELEGLDLEIGKLRKEEAEAAMQ